MTIFYDLATNQRLLDDAEALLLAEAVAKDATLQAAEEKQRAEEERQRAEQAEAEITRLREELTRLRGETVILHSRRADVTKRVGDSEIVLSQSRYRLLAFYSANT